MRRFPEMWHHANIEGISSFQMSYVSDLALFIQMSTKDAVSHEILCYDAVSRLSKLLDQFSDGLNSTGLLELMKTFPDQFVHLFTYTACVSPTDVQEAIYVAEMSNVECEEDVIIVMDHLTKFITDASEKGQLKNFPT